MFFRCDKLADCAISTSLVVLPDIERPQKEGSVETCDRSAVVHLADGGEIEADIIVRRRRHSFCGTKEF